MKTIKRTAQFKRDLKREMRGQHRSDLQQKLSLVLQWLATDTPLPSYMHDHPLSGNLKDCRDCHIKPDLVLVYKKNNDSTLGLVRLGSHSELNI